MTRDLPPLRPTPASWARAVAADLPTFLADHALCEQQAAQMALALVGQYPGDQELVERMGALAAEEITHFRRVAALLHRRSLTIGRRRANPFVHGLRSAMRTERAEILKVDRLMVSAIIEARSCERFACAAAAIDDTEVAGLLADLGPAEARHWRTFHDLALRGIPEREGASHWRRWLQIEDGLARSAGRLATVHG